MFVHLLCGSQYRWCWLVARLGCLRRAGLARWQVRLDLYQLAGAPGPDAAFNSALLDHGALVCRAEQPRCDQCPVIARCVAQGGRAPAPELLVSEEFMNAA